MEFELNNQQYRAAKLDVFAQLKISRKLLPFLTCILGDLKDGKLSIEAALPKVARSISDLKDEDVDAVLHPCLAVVSRKVGTNWAPIFNSGVLMFDDIDLLSILNIAAKVIGDSLGNFFQGLRTSEENEQPQQA